jgi:hypothetical protein
MGPSSMTTRGVFFFYCQGLVSGARVSATAVCQMASISPFATFFANG